MNYAELDAKLQGRCRQHRKLYHNTWAERDWLGTNIYIRLYQTSILCFSSNGQIRLNSGGWHTVTTKDRLNRYLPMPLRVISVRGVWYLAKSWIGWRDKKFRVPFHDGMIVRENGYVPGGTVEFNCALN